MRYGRAVRRASLGRLRYVPARGFCLLRVMKGISEVVGRALGLGELRSSALMPTLPSRASLHDQLPWRGGVLYGSQKPAHTTEPPLSSRHTSPLTLPEQVRSVMRLLPNSIVICTSTNGATPRGMTMSSFASLSLSPTPLISFNIGTPSRTLDAIRESRSFNIHIMCGNASGAAIADRFTQGNAEEAFDGLQHVTVGQQMGEEMDEGASKAPLLVGDGVLYALRCRLLPDEPTRGLIRVRDHVIVVGEVLGVIPGSGATSSRQEFGLAYADRKYRQVGGVIGIEFKR